jgi:hypothetical protein
MFAIEKSTVADDGDDGAVEQTRGLQRVVDSTDAFIDRCDCGRRIRFRPTL